MKKINDIYENITGNLQIWRNLWIKIMEVSPETGYELRRKFNLELKDIENPENIEENKISQIITILNNYVNFNTNDDGLSTDIGVVI